MADKPTDLSHFDFSDSSQKRESLAGTTHAVQSNMFEITLALNPLIAAAAPLLATVTQLRDFNQAPNFETLHQKLCHEIKALEHQAQQLNYRSQVILAARYLICALVDETILTRPWGKNSPWQRNNLLTAFQNETWGGERFFLILERCAEDPALYIDALELGYICLSLGFQGKYKEGHQLHDLGIEIDRLYDVIRQQRGDFSRQLLIKNSDEAPQAAPWWRRNLRWQMPPIWLTLIFTAMIFTLVFIPYRWKLRHLSRPIAQKIQQLSQTNHHGTKKP